MNLNNHRTVVDDVIGNAIGSVGRHTHTVQALPKKRVKASDFGANEGEISRVKRLVMKNYERDFNLGTTLRIINAIEHLRLNYPEVMLPVTLLYWMCMPGNETPSPIKNEVLVFSKRVSRCKTAMLKEYGTSFFMVGGTKVRTGYFRAYINQQELAKYEAPKAGINLVRAHTKAATLSQAIGKVDALKVDADFTTKQKESAKDFVRLVATIGQSIKGYLPAAPPKPTAPKPMTGDE